MIAYSIGAAVILGLAGLSLAAVAIVLRIRARHHWSLSELADLSRDDIDPHWEQVRRMLDGPPPSQWDPCLVKNPHRPEDPPQPPQRGDSHASP